MNIFDIIHDMSFAYKSNYARKGELKVGDLVLYGKYPAIVLSESAVKVVIKLQYSTVTVKSKVGIFDNVHRVNQAGINFQQR